MTQNTDQRVLAVDITSRGFGFVVMESPNELVDWGVKEARDNKHKVCLMQLAKLLYLYHPHCLVFEDCSTGKRRRSKRVRSLLDDFKDAATRQSIKTTIISWKQVRKAFVNGQRPTKQKIASSIAEQLPALMLRLPRPRKPWMSEDYRMSIFDAAAFALTYYAKSK